MMMTKKPRKEEERPRKRTIRKVALAIALPQKVIEFLAFISLLTLFLL
jgi:hypothetical protein